MKWISAAEDGSLCFDLKNNGPVEARLIELRSLEAKYVKEIMLHGVTKFELATLRNQLAEMYEALKESHAELMEALESAKPYVDEKSGIGMNGPNTAAFVQAHIFAVLANARKIMEGL